VEAFQQRTGYLKANILGQGNFAEVWRVSDGKEDFALKEFTSPESATNESGREYQQYAGMQDVSVFALLDLA
jgi:hypothetical protein